MTSQQKRWNSYTLCHLRLFYRGSCLWNLGPENTAGAMKGQLQDRVQPSHYLIWKISLILAPGILGHWECVLLSLSYELCSFPVCLHVKCGRVVDPEDPELIQKKM